MLSWPFASVWLECDDIFDNGQFNRRGEYNEMSSSRPKSARYDESQKLGNAWTIKYVGSRTRDHNISKDKNQSSQP
jgi:hypothetical protein